MNNAHHILGVSRNATNSEVKKAYRRLAKMHHPDVAGKNSEKKFHQIKSAYEFLINPDRLPVQQIKSNLRRSAAEDKAMRLKEARKRLKEQQYKEYLAEQAYFKQQTTGRRRFVFNAILAISVCLNILLILDMILPGKWERIEVIEVNKSKEFGGLKHGKVYPIKADGDRLFMLSKQANELSKYGYLSIEKSFILKTMKRLAVRDGSNYWLQSPGFSQASSFPLMNILLLIPLLTNFLFKRRNLFFFLMYRTSLYGVPIIWLVMLFFYF